MKRTYIKPAVEILDIETTETCFKAVSWRVKGDNTNPDTDHGYIIEDNENFNKKDDPWDSDNW
mgnify:FL=1